MLIAVKCYCGSMAEQLIRNEQVVSSILTTSSKNRQVQKRLPIFIFHLFSSPKKNFFNF